MSCEKVVSSFKYSYFSVRLYTEQKKERYNFGGETFLNSR